MTGAAAPPGRTYAGRGNSVAIRCFAVRFFISSLWLFKQFCLQDICDFDLFSLSRTM